VSSSPRSCQDGTDDPIGARPIETELSLTIQCLLGYWKVNESRARSAAILKSDCKKRARLNAIRYVLHKLPYTGKAVGKIGPLDPLLVGRAYNVYEAGERDSSER
jgi:hypothetical protein